MKANCIVLVLVLLLCDSRARKKKVHSVNELFAEYYCYKLKSCRASDKKVCGYDNKVMMLAVFEDICTLYRANCKKYGAFQKVEMAVCEMQKSYEAEYNVYNDTFDFLHVGGPLMPKGST